jgi:peptidoglycan/LPS O-acetylase OafA/YrhL
MNATVPETEINHSHRKTVRLHYLDWLRVILILGVFLYHAVSPFREGLDWHITNPERSATVTSILIFIWPWALPLFFLVAGAASKFALRRRSNRQYIRERVARLLVPLIVGSILLSPLQAYLEALNDGSYQGPFLGFLPEMLADKTSGNLFSPLIFTEWGFHLWFLGFLFAYSILALPIFNWFKRDAGQSFIAWLARLVDKRGGILLFIIPLALVRVLVQPFYPEEHGWLDFIYSFLFFVLGYILYSDERFLSAIRRDRWLLVGGGVLNLVAFGALFAIAGDAALEWVGTEVFVVPGSIIGILLFTLSSWCWALCVLYLAMTHWDSSNRWLVYGNETIVPIYVFHQPVIVVIAFFVVQWQVGIPVKLLVVVLGSLVVTLGLIELVIKRINVLRGLFGMKARRPSTEAA